MVVARDLACPPDSVTRHPGAVAPTLKEPPFNGVCRDTHCGVIGLRF